MHIVSLYTFIYRWAEYNYKILPTIYHGSVTNFSSLKYKALQRKSFTKNNGCLQLPQKMSVDAPFTQFNTRYFWQCGFYIRELWIFLNVALNTQWGLEFLAKQGTIVQGHFRGWHGGIWDCIMQLMHDYRAQEYRLSCSPSFKRDVCTAWESLCGQSKYSLRSTKEKRVVVNLYISLECPKPCWPIRSNEKFTCGTPWTNIIKPT
jgi:hypothetical protein